MIKRNFKIVLKYLIIIPIILVISTSTLAKSHDKVNYLRCNHSTDCLCIEQNELQISCPKSENGIFLIIKPNNEVVFECLNVNNKDYELIPHYDLQTGNIFIFKCPLIAGMPILSSYLKNIKINNIRSIQFVSSGVSKAIKLEAKHFEGFQDVIEFDFQSMAGEFEHLEEDLFKNMTNIRTLEIRVPNVHFPEKLLFPLINVDTLELRSNQIETIPPGFFRNQQKLKSLSLMQNKLRNLSKDSFIGLESLEVLKLAHNKLEVLDVDSLKPLKNLTEIDLSSNWMNSLPEGFFSENKQLRLFKLFENNGEMTLPNGFFVNLTQLEKVLIGNCKLTTLPEDLFAGARNIKTILLYSSEIRSLPDKIFVNLSELERIDLSGNLITQLSVELFKHTSSLELLNLTNNQIQRISSLTFNSLTNLEELYIDSNKIEGVENSAFSGLVSATIISLKNNSLSMPALSNFRGLTNLKRLDLSHNEIEKVLSTNEEPLNGVPMSLDLLDLSYNNISNPDFQGLVIMFFFSDMLVVDFSNNKIENLGDVDLLENYSFSQFVMTIDISQNPLNCDCNLWNFIKYVTSYKSVIKSNSESDRLLCGSPTQLANRTFQDISLSDLVCPFEKDSDGNRTCPVNCHCQKRPEDKMLLLNCSCPFNIDDLKLTQLTEDNESYKIGLRIHKCRADELPLNKSLIYQEVIQLDLSNLNISELTTEHLPNHLEVLDLSNNRIQSMNEPMIDFIKRLPLRNFLFFLDGNSVKCDCENKNYINFINTMNKQNILQSFSDIKCINGTKLEILEVGSLCSQNYYIILILGISIAIVGTILGFLAALYYKYQRQIKMWLYAHDQCLWFVTEAEIDKEKKFDAFVSYSHHDEDFVNDYLVPELEQKSAKYKLCVHVRDWAPGIEISTQISNSVNDAKRTIIIMSPNYLQSNWGEWEFRVAQSHAAVEKRSRLIIVLYGDIGDIDNLEPDIRDYLKLNTYIKWGDKWFWKKLNYAMPHVTSNRQRVSTVISSETRF